MRNDELRAELNTLQIFLRRGVTYQATEVIDWVSNCVAFFSSIGMNESIIAGFMKSFEHREYTSGEALMSSSNIGPFYSAVGTGVNFKLGGNFEERHFHAQMVNIWIAFKTAKNIIDRLEEAERLVPRPLFNFFKQRTEYEHISSTLELLEQNFENKDPEGMFTNSIVLLNSILDLEPTLKGKELSNQLRQIRSDVTLVQKFGIKSEVITALDNSRILRNYLASHKNVPIQYNVPYAVALSTAFLILLVLQIAMATGELIEIRDE